VQTEVVKVVLACALRTQSSTRASDSSEAGADPAGAAAQCVVTLRPSSSPAAAAM
jgi:hypothetical protein